MSFASGRSVTAETGWERVILSLLFYGAGYDTGTTAEAITEAAVMKMSLPPLELFSGVSSAISSSAWPSGAVSAVIPMQVN